MDINNLWSEYDLNSKKQNTRGLAVNTILEGKYLVGPVLGQGGFGITYVGYDLNMEAKIAIKEYFPVELVSRDTTTMHGDRVLSLSGEKSVTYKQGLNKYVAEAQNVSRFSEIPGVVSVKDFFYANETAYIVMEFIDGISLKDYLKEKGGSLTEEETLKIMKPVLEALVQVHKSGIIHRDISPDNIMLTFKDGKAHKQIESVKLIDFGAARMTAKNDQKSLTIILKHGYAPEEQYRTHGKQGPWTDVYALCAVLYRMLTGETPVPAMDRMFQDDLKTFDKFNTKVSANTAAAILKGLAVKKGDRTQSVQELISVLYEGMKVRWTSVKQNTKNRLIIATGVAAVVIAIIASTVLIGGKSGDTEQMNSVSITETTKNDTGVTSVSNENLSLENMIEFQEEEEIGEQIVFYSPMNSIAVTEAFTLFCMPDGTVKARGNNEDRQCNVEEWDHVVAVAASNFHSLGLRSDGTVYAAGADRSGECQVDTWKNVVAIEAYPDLSLGITADGTVLIAGISREEIDLSMVAPWNDMIDIACGGEYVIGIKKDGSLVWEGAIDGLSQNPEWQNVDNLKIMNNWLFGIESDGTVHALVVDASMQLPQEYVNYYNHLPKMRNISVSNFVSNYFAVTAEGEVMLMEDNEYAWGYEAALELIENTEDFNQKMLAVSMDESGYVYGITESGEFLEHYMNSYGNCELEELQDIKNVCLIRGVGNRGPGIAAQTGNGKVMYYGNERDESQFCEQLSVTNKIKQYESNRNKIGVFLMEDGDVVSIVTEHPNKSAVEAYPDRNVKAMAYHYDQKIMTFLMKDGSVKLCPGREDMTMADVPQELAADWKDMKHIWQFNNCVYGLREDGMILKMVPGEQNWGEVDLSGYAEVFVNDLNFIGLTDDGVVKILELFWGDDESGKYQIEGWTDITDLAFGTSHTVGLKKDGKVVATGSNHCGQCDVEAWTDIIAIDANGECTLGLTKDGRVLMTGSLCK